MSITIRLTKIGRKNTPSFRIVVANTRDKRNGKFLDILGHFNPSMNPVQFNYDKERFEEWKKKGALISEAVEKLVSGDYKFVPYRPNKAAADNAEKAE
jgi:small subunit ribosomal protein S16